MINKSKENLNTKDQNQITQILINYVKNSPNFFDSCKNQNQKDQILKELQSKAKQIANDYIKKVNEKEEKERKIREEKQARERAEREAKEARARAERERVARERAEREARERAERERIAREKAEREARERVERERIARERAEREAREARERAERERIARESSFSPYFPRTPYTGVSIVDGLAAIGVVQSFNYRAQIAERNGIQGYLGSPAQNTLMLNLLKNGQLLKP